MNSNYKCWDFIMSSFVRLYGIDKVMREESFHIFSLEWCDENNYSCDIFCDLNEIDEYFKGQYENWNN